MGRSGCTGSQAAPCRRTGLHWSGCTALRGKAKAQLQAFTSVVHHTLPFASALEICASRPKHAPGAGPHISTFPEVAQWTKQHEEHDGAVPALNVRHNSDGIQVWIVPGPVAFSVSAGVMAPFSARATASIPSVGDDLHVHAGNVLPK